MTILKAMPVRTASMRGLQRYLERDGRCARLGTLNVSDERTWAAEMDELGALERVPERTAKRGYHFVIAFNLDDISPVLPDGSPNEEAIDFAEAYAREFAEAELSGLQVAWVVHIERCDADGTSRLAAHIVAGRAVVSDFAYPDGSGRVARAGTLYDRRRSVQREQIERIRSMDCKAGFAEVKIGRNSRTHFVRGTSTPERQIKSRGGTPRKEQLREVVERAAAMPGVTNMASLKASLESKGYSLDIDRSPTNATLTDRDGGRRYRLSTLGVDRAELERRFAAMAAAERAVARGLGRSEGARHPSAGEARTQERAVRVSENEVRRVSRRESSAARLAVRLAESAAALARRVLAALGAFLVSPPPRRAENVISMSRTGRDSER